jgi:O-succinylbenzoate synthase
MTDEMFGIQVGPIATNDLKDTVWVASMFGDGFSALFALPTRDRSGEVEGFAPIVSSRPQDLAKVIQNCEWSKAIKVKMVTGKRYTADLNGIHADIVIEQVKDHKVRIDAFRKQKEQGNE